MSSSSSLPVTDHAERECALDVTRSFIVRAPAGSGKTRLLIQRYLALLAQVDEPEEIVAITFTRKAAAEMKTRVLSAFSAVSRADGSVDADTHRLASAALQRDAARGWQLLANTSRLRMRTIDSLNASITRQMPLLARFGAQPESIDDASGLYAEAARGLLAQVNDTDANAKGIAEDVGTLLAHLDNNLTVAADLLAEVLRSRDHWLRNLRAMHERETLEATLARIRGEAVAQVAALFPAGLRDETLALARLSEQNMLESGVDAGVSHFSAMNAFPGDDAHSLPAWLALGDFLLTKEGSWRKRVDKRQGFPTSTDKELKARLSAQKERMHSHLQTLAEDSRSSERATALHQLRSLPSAAYSESQWQILGAIVRLLPHATAALWDAFSRQGQCDFTEIAQAASRALGHDDAPTDLALALDYRISHLLVDEFQDTSFAQFELLEKLTRGWSEDDGRTLFLVGDPMQSIYRFREAEVSLFSRAWRTGVGGVKLNPLTLSVNFRSSHGVVDWVNTTFGVLMPRTAEANSTAVPYSPSVAFASDDVNRNEQAVTLHPTVLRKSDPDEDARTPPSADEHAAAQVVSIVESTRREFPAASIAILVRNRGHLREIVPALKTANIAYRAVDIDPLNERPVVRDLLSLTRAILHPADRIAWLAVLRAPWCGLTLNDLARLTCGALPVDGVLLPAPLTIWELLCDTASVASLSEDGQERANKFCAAFRPGIQARRRTSLREAVENTWLRLCGPAAVARKSDLDDVATFLALLDREVLIQSSSGDLIDLAALESRVEKLFARGVEEAEKTASPPVQIMTIHKAKGLEFDTVIVPGLHRPPRRDDKKLLVWTEQANPATGERELLVAPIRETGAEEDVDADSIYRYVLQLDREKQRAEIVRLLYVAATRAERRLHLLGTFSINGDADDGNDVREFAQPKADSLLAALWPALPTALLAEADDADTAARMTPRATNVDKPQVPMRITQAQRLPQMPTAVLVGRASDPGVAESDLPNIDFEWASEVARHVGSVVHLFLQRIAEDGIGNWSKERVAKSTPAIKRELVRCGATTDELPAAVERVVEALVNTLGDPRGRWTLGSHREARTEWRLTRLQDDSLFNVIIDRTFIDDKNARWIIDFKTGSHEGADVDAFLDSEKKRYRVQLETYASILRDMEAGAPIAPIRLGLYFPLLKGWREWQWGTTARDQP